MKIRKIVWIRAVVACVGILLLCLQTGRVSADVITETEVPLLLLEGEKYCTYNLDQIDALCEQATERMKIVIKVAKPGTYYVGDGDSTRAIHLRSNVTLDLNGSTLIRAELMGNMIQNCAMDGTRDGGGYELSHDITVRNGTLDGEGGEDADVNLVNIGHAKNVRLESLMLKNCQGAHLIELSGCSDVVISNCMFDGFDGNRNEGEAIQLDVSYNGTGQNWNGAYEGDGTACKNITVDGCVFFNYPTGVGNHHAVSGGEHNQNITIINNLFMNKRKTEGTAIWCYGFEGCVISNNVILGNYSYGIRVSGGSDITVRENVIGSEEDPVNGHGIYFTLANSYIRDQGKETSPERPDGASIANNQVYVDGSGKYGIFICNGSKVDEIVGNKIISGGGDGIRVTGQGSTVTSIGRMKKNAGNTISAKNGWGIAFGKEAQGLRIVGNSIYSGEGGDGIQIASGSYVESIGTDSYPNVIDSYKGNGIVVTGASTVAWISCNRIFAQEGAGVVVQKESFVDSIEYNTISKGCTMGISVTQSSLVRDINDNTIREYSNSGIYTSSSASLESIRKNVISGGTGAGIYITNSEVSEAIQGNKISNCKSAGGHGISVTSTGFVSKIKSNEIANTEGYGIKVTNASAHTTLRDNAFKKNKLGKTYVSK